jgi:hypothetical protein
MLDRYNQLHEAWWTQQQGWQLTAAPLAKLGPGRPLGYHFDHNGDLIVADSLKARLLGWCSAAAAARKARLSTS